MQTIRPLSAAGVLLIRKAKFHIAIVPLLCRSKVAEASRPILHACPIPPGVLPPGVAGSLCVHVAPPSREDAGWGPSRPGGDLLDRLSVLSGARIADEAGRACPSHADNALAPA